MTRNSNPSYEIFSIVIPSDESSLSESLEMTTMKLRFIVGILFVTSLVPQVYAANQPKLGVHILEAEEVSGVARLFPNGGYVTIPVRLDQLDRKKWQKFFDDSDRSKIIPMMRLATAHDGSWERPSKKDIVAFASFFSSLDWHRSELIIIAFNEPNHAPEWGGNVDAENYTELLTFLANWFHTESRRYIILPAALDAAAGSSMTTQPARAFLAAMVSYNPELMDQIDGWNSHAYPNPGFSGLPTDTHAMSVQSYRYELEFIKQKTGKSLPVYITETGWDHTKKKGPVIAQYFRSAYEKIWEPDDRVVAVTPFLFNAQTKPFSDFSLLDANEKPTPLYDMIKKLNTRRTE